MVSCRMPCRLLARTVCPLLAFTVTHLIFSLTFGRVQAECMQWFERQQGCAIPMISIEKSFDADDANTVVAQFRNGDFLQNVMTHGCRRFIIMYKRRHVMCCQIVQTATGRACKVMDTMQKESPVGSAHMLQTLASCFNLPVSLPLDPLTCCKLSTHMLPSSEISGTHQKR
jgi:hypothetical protein